MLAGIEPYLSEKKIYVLHIYFFTPGFNGDFFPPAADTATTETVMTGQVGDKDIQMVDEKTELFLAAKQV